MTLKKLLAGFLASAMTLSAGILPNFTPAMQTVFTANAENTDTSGTCGENVTWQLDSDGVLTISGTGDMYDYDYDYDSPFYERTDIKSVIIKDGVTSIGGWAFEFCTSLKSVTIGNSVTSIGKYAFSVCESLESITIPDSVTSIGFNAFEYTPWLDSKRVENPLVIINSILIDGRTCSGDIVISKSVTSICGGAFSFCESLKSVTIPDSVTSIGEWAFSDCTGLTSVTIPDSIVSIENSAFASCLNLESVIILNPECEIDDSNGTISSGYDYDYDGDGYYFNGIIYGYENSTAQEYAKKYGKKFESLGEYVKVWKVLDLVKLQKYIVDIETEINDEYDLNGDDEINVFDAMILRNKLIYG